MNLARLEQVMRFLTAYPELHAQETWIRTRTSCGTVACLAGWTCLLNGYEPEMLSGDWVGEDGSLDTSRVRAPEDPVDASRDVVTTAVEILGIGDRDANALFSGAHTLDSLWQRVEMLTDGQVTR